MLLSLTHPPSNAQLLAEFWGDLLRLPDVSATDDFFLAGGHSLLAIQLTSKISKEVGVKLSMAQLVEHSVLRDMAALVEEASGKVAGGYDAAGAPEVQVVGPGEMPFQVTDTPQVGGYLRSMDLLRKVFNAFN